MTDEIMGKFDDVKELHEDTDIDAGYKDITPTENYSDSEIDDFWESEFRDAEAENEIDPYDELVSEAFNRSEDELDIDFDIDSNLSGLLESFSPEVWRDLDEDDRYSFAKEFADALGEKMGLTDSPEIVLADRENGTYGGYIPSKNCIEINRMYLDDPKELIDTIAHEMRHAYQHYRADVLETREDALFRVNFDNYITPLELPGGGYLMFYDYWNQYVEVDARAFANKFTEAMA